MTRSLGKVLTVKVFSARRFKVYVDAFNVALHFTKEKFINRALRRRPLRKRSIHVKQPRRVNPTHLHLRLELILQHTIEFLNVMLHERIKRLPPKRLGQFSRPYESN